MGRLRDAWRALQGAEAAPPPPSVAEDGSGSGHSSDDLAWLDERYVRRDQVTRLMAQTAELELSIAGVLDRLNTVAARMRKREQRAAAADEAAGSPETAEDGHPGDREAGHSKAALYGRLRGLQQQRGRS